MPLPVIVANNQTASPIVLNSLGLTVPASGSLTLTSSAFLTEANESPELVSEVDAGNLTLTINGVALDGTQSANYLNPGATALGTRRDYGALAADPTLPAPSAGDSYYNTVMEMPMSYDGARAKWLSVETQTLSFSRQTSPGPTGTILRPPGGVTPNGIDSRGLVTLLWNATIVGAADGRQNAALTSYTVEDLVPTTYYTFNTAAANSSIDTAANADIPQSTSILVRNNGPGNTTRPTVTLRVKWRAT